MKRHFFRVQHKGISFEEMQNFVSASGGDWDEEVEGYEAPEGLCVCSRPDGNDGGSQFGGALGAMDPDDELVILEGVVLSKIYDGYRIHPTREVARFTIAQWEKMLEDESAWEYETW